MLNREGVLNQLFGIQNYVQLMCSHKPDYSEPTPLLQTCMQFINAEKNNNQSNNNTPNLTNSNNTDSHVLVLEGKSGGGKSLFILELLRHLNKLYQQDKIEFMHVVYLQLREHSEGYVQAN